MDEDLYAHIQAIARRLFPDRDDHMDLAHEAVVKVLEHMDEYDESKGSLKAWASIISANRMRDFVRDEAAQKRTEGKYAQVYPGAAYNT